MAILARHLYFDFPEYYNIFGRTSDYAAGKRIWTTNRLLKSYPGADGLKTGYTRAAGYNLAATAHRGDKRDRGRAAGRSLQRTAQPRGGARLLDLGFGRAIRRRAQRRGRRAPGRLLVAEAPVPEEKPEAPATGFAALAEALRTGRRSGDAAGDDDAGAVSIDVAVAAGAAVRRPAGAPDQPGGDDARN